jgi:predicted nuclease of predicted toxin-antitoxin system
LEKIKFLTDENFRRAILDGVLARLPDLDILRVQDAGLRTYSDPKILEVAALENRILLTHDVRTMETHARARIAKSKPMPGVMIIREQVPIGKAIEGIILIAECDHPEEWNGIIRTRPRHPTRSFLITYFDY